MTEKEDIFEKAVESLRRQEVPPGPPRELADATMAKLAQCSASSSDEDGDTNSYISQRQWPKAFGSFGKIAAAAVLMIAAGYTAGRWSAPRPLDMEQIRVALEPVIRQNLLDETRQYVQSGLASGYVQMRDELSRQYRQDLSKVAIQTLAASNSITNELLTELIESVNTAQNQDRQWFAAALEQVELNRLRDKSQLSNAFATFAVQTEDELNRTKKDVAQVLSYALPDSRPAPSDIETQDNSNERIEK
jgi:hypothetical protein